MLPQIAEVTGINLADSLAWPIVTSSIFQRAGDRSNRNGQRSTFAMPCNCADCLGNMTGWLSSGDAGFGPPRNERRGLFPPSLVELRRTSRYARNDEEQQPEDPPCPRANASFSPRAPSANPNPPT